VATFTVAGFGFDGLLGFTADPFGFAAEVLAFSGADLMAEFVEDFEFEDLGAAFLPEEVPLTGLPTPPLAILTVELALFLVDFGVLEEDVGRIAIIVSGCADYL
jgi:hypothetical protein